MRAAVLLLAIILALVALVRAAPAAHVDEIHAHVAARSPQDFWEVDEKCAARLIKDRCPECKIVMNRECRECVEDCRYECRI
ncbi:hypothetical protein H9P43_009551 [Blastocladiella emersonii ATCC 22665]|nr:hypothetical protein H9P43_009551 [Blastocladiella emersonii ATCC 22665]